MTKLNSSLLSWYEKSKRPLLWRKSRDPYSIWISEIMLQQTTVAAVTPYYERFMGAFPNIESLARAREEKVLGLWAGLGYYSRARNLHKAAKEISKLLQFPNSYSQLINLPGIGPYTAAAIASIAFDEPVAAIDGNVVRVVSRLFDIKSKVSSKTGQEELRQKAQSLIDGQPPSEHNQAMMELGATLCLPKNPTCFLCPVRNFCQSYKNGTQLLRPVKAKKESQKPWLWTLYINEDKDGRIALVKNGNGSPWLNHLWGLPGHARPLKKKERPSEDFRHSITSHKIFVRVVRKNKALFETKEIKWLKPSEIKKQGVSSVVLKALKHLDQK